MICERRILEADPVEAGADPVDVRRHQRPHVGVDDRRRRPLVLALLAQDLARERDRRVGQLLGEDRADALLVLGVEVGVEEADGDRVDPELAQPAGERAHLVLVERAARRCRRPPSARRPRSAAAARRAAAACARRGRTCAGSAAAAARARRGSPRVVTSAVSAPRRCRTAFVATVVPCTTSLDRGRRARCPRARRRPRPRPGRSSAASRAACAPGRRPSASWRITSVNVPPTSTPIRSALAVALSLICDLK